MADAVSTLSDSFLSLSAGDLRDLTSWPDALIEDYLSILRNLLSLANIIDVDIDGQIVANAGQIQMAIGKLAAMQRQVSDLEGSQSANAAQIFKAIGALTQIDKGLDEVAQLESADHANALFSSFSVFGAPPAIGTVRMSPGYFSQGAAGINSLRDDINSVTPDWQVDGPDGGSSLSVVRNSNGTGGADIYLGKSRASENGGVTIVQDGDDIGTINFVAADGADLNTVVATITAVVDDASPSANAIAVGLQMNVMNTAGALNTFYSVTPTRLHTFSLGDNLASAYNITQSANSYIDVVTTNGSEAIRFGNTTTNQEFTFRGSGKIFAVDSDLTLTNGDIEATNGSITGASLVDTSAVLISSGVALTNGSGASAGTLTNAPSAGNPGKWVEIDDNGTSRYIPTWT